MYSTFTTFIFSIIFMALNNLIDKDKKKWISHCDVIQIRNLTTGKTK